MKKKKKFVTSVFVLITELLVIFYTPMASAQFVICTLRGGGGRTEIFYEGSRPFETCKIEGRYIGYHTFKRHIQGKRTQVVDLFLSRLTATLAIPKNQAQHFCTESGGRYFKAKQVGPTASEVAFCRLADRSLMEAEVLFRGCEAEANFCSIL